MPSYDENSVLTLAGLKTALTRAKAETLAAIAAAGHLSKKKVDAVPEAASAEENTFYFVKNNGKRGGKHLLLRQEQRYRPL